MVREIGDRFTGHVLQIIFEFSSLTLFSEYLSLNSSQCLLLSKTTQNRSFLESGQKQMKNIQLLPTAK